MSSRRTYRTVDGVSIPGVWRPVFRKNGNIHFLTDLFIYADGTVRCWESHTLDEFRAKLDCGCITADPPEGATASAHHLGTWTLTNMRGGLSSEMLFGEVLDEIDRLNERPDSAARCLAAVDDYLADPTPDNQLAARAAYLAVPAHLRTYMLGDMDTHDWPVRVLISELGQPLVGLPAHPHPVTAENRQTALDYFARRADEQQRYADQRPAYRYDDRTSPTTSLTRTVYPKGWPAEPGLTALTLDYPIAITAFGREFRSVIHGLLALAVADPETGRLIEAAETPERARTLAKDAVKRADWYAVRLALLATLLRAKYAQHPHLAALLLATGDGRIVYNDIDDAFWVASAKEGANWVGRLHEVIRSELALAAGTDVIRNAEAGYTA